MPDVVGVRPVGRFVRIVPRRELLSKLLSNGDGPGPGSPPCYLALRDRCCGGR
jgi:hypothetical protein